MKKRGIYRSLALLLSFITSLFFLTTNSLAGGPEVSPNYWTMSGGVFGSYYNASYRYQATYEENSPAIGSAYENVQQLGVGAGAEIAAYYHYTHYFFGLGLSGQLNSDKAYISNTFITQRAASGVFLVDTQLRINGNIDASGILGIDATPQTHIYGRMGVSYAHLRQNLQVLAAGVPGGPGPESQQSNSQWIFGYLAGLGISRDLGKRVSLYAEYDYYTYGGHNLSSIADILPHPNNAGTVSVYTQNALIDAYAVRIGLNVNFAV